MEIIQLCHKRCTKKEITIYLYLHNVIQGSKEVSKDELIQFVPIWIKKEAIILSKIRQQKEKYYVIACIYVWYTKRKNKAINNHMIMKPGPWITKLRFPAMEEKMRV